MLLLHVYMKADNYIHDILSNMIVNTFMPTFSKDSAVSTIHPINQGFSHTPTPPPATLMYPIPMLAWFLMCVTEFT